jgi:2-acylglycerol O-acyltransferase 2
MVNANGCRKPRHLYILPGGVAEIFVSTPGKHAIVFKSRKGLCKLSIETGAKLTPCYVFGGTDFFFNLATGDGLLSKISRSLKAGLTIFWGRFGLPIPFTPRVTFVIGEPIPVPVGWDGKGPIPVELINELHETYMKAMVELFDTHKAVAGYPDAKLEIL